MKRLFRIIACQLILMFICVNFLSLFSIFAVNEEDLSPYEQKNLVILLDSSGSMDEKKRNFVTDALISCLANPYHMVKTNESLMVYLVPFNGEIYKEFSAVDIGTDEGYKSFVDNVKLINKSDVLINEKNEIFTCWSGYTNIGGALQYAYNILSGIRGKNAILLFTDGEIYTGLKGSTTKINEELALDSSVMCAEKNIQIFTCGLDPNGAFHKKTEINNYSNAELLGALTNGIQLEEKTDSKGEKIKQYTKYTIGKKNAVSGIYTISANNINKEDFEHSLLTSGLSGVSGFFRNLLQSYNININEPGEVEIDPGKISDYTIKVTQKSNILKSVILTLVSENNSIGDSSSNKRVRIVKILDPNNKEITNSVKQTVNEGNALDATIDEPISGNYVIKLYNNTDEKVVIHIYEILNYKLGIDASVKNELLYCSDDKVIVTLYDEENSNRKQIVSDELLNSKECNITVESCKYKIADGDNYRKIREYEGKTLSYDNYTHTYFLNVNSLSENGIIPPGIYEISFLCTFRYETGAIEVSNDNVSEPMKEIKRSTTVSFIILPPIIEVKPQASRVCAGYTTNITVQAYSDESKTVACGLQKNINAYYSVNNGEKIKINPDELYDGTFSLETQKFANEQTIKYDFVFELLTEDGVNKAFESIGSANVEIADPIPLIKRIENNPVNYNSDVSFNIGLFSDEERTVSLGTEALFNGDCILLISKDDKVLKQKAFSSNDIISAEGSYLYEYDEGFPSIGKYRFDLILGTNNDSGCSVFVEVVPYDVTFDAQKCSFSIPINKFSEQLLSLDDCFNVSSVYDVINSVKASEYIKQYKLKKIDKTAENSDIDIKFDKNNSRNLYINTNDVGNWSIVIEYLTNDGYVGTATFNAEVTKADYTDLILLIIIIAAAVLVCAIVIFILCKLSQLPTGRGVWVKINFNKKNNDDIIDVESKRVFGKNKKKINLSDAVNNYIDRSNSNVDIDEVKYNDKYNKTVLKGAFGSKIKISVPGQPDIIIVVKRCTDQESINSAFNDLKFGDYTIKIAIYKN